MKSARSFLKFFIKIYVIGPLRSFLLFLFGSRAMHVTNDTKSLFIPKRILIINLEGIGDMVAFTSVLKHYRNAFPGARISLLMKESFGLERAFGTFVHEVVSLHYKKFAQNPWYGYRVISALRRHGFNLAIAHDHSAAELMGKIIALAVGASKTIAYEGFRLQYEKPFDENMRFALSYAQQKLFPRFTHIVSSIDHIAQEHETHGIVRGSTHLENVIEHYCAIYEFVAGRRETDYKSELSAKEYDVKNFGSYVVMNLSSSQPWKNWPLERFLDVADEFKKRNIRIVLVGALGERHLAEMFVLRYHGVCSDLVGKLSIEETISLIARARLVFSNDTSATHIAIALQKPTLTILGVGHLGSNSFYGYEDINKWVYTESPCWLDNWRCATKALHGEPAPCILAVSTSSVRQELRELLDYISVTPQYPQKTFSTSFYHHEKNS